MYVRPVCMYVCMYVQDSMYCFAHMKSVLIRLCPNIIIIIMANIFWGADLTSAPVFVKSRLVCFRMLYSAEAG